MGHLRMAALTLGATVLFTTQSSVIEFQQVALGKEGACTLSRDGKTYCWRWSDAIEDGTDRLEVRVTALPQLPAFESITAGREHTCGLALGRVWCWGSNKFGQLGRWGRDTALQAVQVPAAVMFAAIAAGASHSCGLTTTDQVWCWGDQWEGSTGTMQTGESVHEPAPVRGRNRFVSVSSGEKHSCAVTNHQRVHCWGDNSLGAVRSGRWTTYFSPVEVSEAGEVNRVFVGPSLSCGIKSTGSMVCWGRGLGRLPERIGNVRLESVAIGDSGLCALSSARTALCWAADPSGAPDIRLPLTADTVMAEGTVTLRLRALLAGGSRFCGIDAANRVWCWHNDAPRAARQILVR